MEFDIKSFGKMLLKLRNEKNYTRATAYKKSKVSSDTLRLIEKGERLPTIDTLLKLSRLYEVNLIRLLADYCLNTEITLTNVSK